ncbi:MAG: RNA-binding protein [Candidatus Aenigmarchaeota archaeon]|nr:RNA-binding protein [Candidatus Aenigmarchaeota archaeon]
MPIRCTSCKENLLSEDNFTKFPCPDCLKSEITRCMKCRRKNNIYTCPSCGFEGP